MKRLPVRPRPPRIHALILAVHLGLALSYAGLVGMAFARGETWRADFTDYYTGALLIREGHGAALYDLDLQGRRQRALLSGRHLYDGLLPYHHPPYVALLLSPLAALPLPVAFGVWTALNALIWAGFLWDLGRWARPWGGTARALTVSAVAALPGVLFSFLLGASTVWTVVALWGFYRALRTGREGAAGFYLALASVRPQAVLFPALLLFTIRKWRALSTFLGAVALLVGISAWALGPAIWADYLIVLGKAATAFSGGRRGQLPGRTAVFHPPPDHARMDDRAFPADPEASMSAWERWIFRLLLSVLIGWEAILAGYKLGKFPYHAVDFAATNSSAFASPPVASASNTPMKTWRSCA